MVSCQLFRNSREHNPFLELLICTYMHTNSCVTLLEIVVKYRSHTNYLTLSWPVKTWWTSACAIKVRERFRGQITWCIAALLKLACNLLQDPLVTARTYELTLYDMRWLMIMMSFPYAIFLPCDIRLLLSKCKVAGISANYCPPLSSTCNIVPKRLLLTYSVLSELPKRAHANPKIQQCLQLKFLERF